MIGRERDGDDVALVLTTAGSRDEAAATAHALVSARLAACVQAMPIASTYRWNGAVEQAEEVLLLCKIRKGDFAEVAEAIRSQSSYDVAEIVMVAADAVAGPYRDWLLAETVR